jgi:hypothetical protein
MHPDSTIDRESESANREARNSSGIFSAGTIFSKATVRKGPREGSSASIRALLSPDGSASNSTGPRKRSNIPVILSRVSISPPRTMMKAFAGTSASSPGFWALLSKSVVVRLICSRIPLIFVLQNVRIKCARIKIIIFCHRLFHQYNPMPEKDIPFRSANSHISFVHPGFANLPVAGNISPRFCVLYTKEIENHFSTVSLLTIN